MPEEEPKGNPINARRDDISDSYVHEEPIKSEPEKEVVKEVPVEKVTEEKPKAELKQEEQKRKYAGKFESPEDLEKAYEGSLKGMNDSQKKAAELEKQFQQIRGFVDWDKLRSTVSGQPQPNSQQVPGDEQKQRFFEDFANRGPQFLDERVANAVRQAAPQIIQVATFQTKLADAYEDFVDNNPELIPFEEQIGKLMYEKIASNSKLTIRKAMKESIKDFKETLDGIKNTGRKEAQVAFEEKKKDGIPSTERASPEKPKPKEEQPETLDDVINLRRSLQDKYRSVRSRR